MEQVRHHGHEACLGQLVGHLTVEIVQSAYVEGDHYGGMWARAVWEGSVHIHFAAANGQFVSKTRHGESPLIRAVGFGLGNSNRFVS